MIDLLISKDDLDNGTKNASSEWPFCVLYRDPSAWFMFLEIKFGGVLECVNVAPQEPHTTCRFLLSLGGNFLTHIGSKTFTKKLLYPKPCAQSFLQL